MKELEKEILQWHSEIIPNATIKALEEKFDEESKELFKAIADDRFLSVFTRESAQEFADMIIVFTAGLRKSHIPPLSYFIEEKLNIIKHRKLGKELPNGDRERACDCKKIEGVYWVSNDKYCRGCNRRLEV